jgi:hypothetical protein
MRLFPGFSRNDRKAVRLLSRRTSPVPCISIGRLAGQQAPDKLEGTAPLPRRPYSGGSRHRSCSTGSLSRLPERRLSGTAPPRATDGGQQICALRCFVPSLPLAFTGVTRLLCLAEPKSGGEVVLRLVQNRKLHLILWAIRCLAASQSANAALPAASCRSRSSRISLCQLEPELSPPGGRVHPRAPP